MLWKVGDIIEVQSTLCLTAVGTQMSEQSILLGDISGLERLQRGDNICSGP